MTLRILEFGDSAAAGYCGRLFALWGAEVVRVDGPSMSDGSEACYLHAGKRRVSLDYMTEEGRALLSSLAGRCDVLITDEAPAVLDWLDWQTLGDDNEVLIKASISPFGLSGPCRDWKGFGPVLLAMGGYTCIVGDPEREPLTIPGNYVEYQAGQYAYAGVMAAVLDGKPEARLVEVSMLETVLSLSQFTTVMWTCNRDIRGRHGNGWANLHPINLYPCRDGWFFVNVVPTFWQAFTRMLGRPDLLGDERFARSASRVENRQALDEIIVECLGDYTMDELLALGQREFRVPTGTLYDMSRVLGDEHLNARRFFHGIRMPDGRRLEAPGSPFRYVEGDKLRPSPDLDFREAVSAEGILEALNPGRSAP